MENREEVIRFHAAVTLIEKADNGKGENRPGPHLSMPGIFSATVPVP